MKRRIEYKAGDKILEKEVKYIPMRYILAALITLL